VILFNADVVLRTIAPLIENRAAKVSLVELAIQQNAIRSDEGLALLAPGNAGRTPQ
jgi:hypothetical protein